LVWDIGIRESIFFFFFFWRPTTGVVNNMDRYRGDVLSAPVPGFHK
jgi:hypothetical protein